MNKKLTKSIILMIVMMISVLSLTGCGVKDSIVSQMSGSQDSKPVINSYNLSGYKKCDKMSGIEFYCPDNYIFAGSSTQPLYTDPDIPGASVNLVSASFPSSFSFEGYVETSVAGLKKTNDNKWRY